MLHGWSGRGSFGDVNSAEDLDVDTESFDEEEATSSSDEGLAGFAEALCRPCIATVRDLQWCCQPSRRCASVFTCAFALFLTGILMGVCVERWSLLTTLYVLMQVVTTIGYGDVTVDTEGMKLFMSFYVLCALVLISHLMNLFVQSWLRKQADMMQSFFLNDKRRAMATVKKKRPQRPFSAEQHRRSRFGEMTPLLASSAILVCAIFAGTITFALMEPCECSYGTGLVEGCDATDVVSCKATGGYEKSFIDAFYMSTITVTTVGFGDHTPRSEEGRAFAIVWCIVGVGCCLNWLRAVTEFLIESQRWREFDMAKMRLDKKIFEEMDSEGTGWLTRHEYLGYALIKHGIVSKGTLDHLNDVFDEMDPRGTNRVTYEQLKKRQLKRQQEREASRKGLFEG